MTFETRLTPEIIERWTRAGFWKPETFYQILSRQADAHPDRQALVDRGRRVTYGELRARGDRVAADAAGGRADAPGPDVEPLDPIIDGERVLPPLRPRTMDANDVMRMAFTSGTTGNPKGVTHNFNTTLAAGRIINADFEVTPDE